MALLKAKERGDRTGGGIAETPAPYFSLGKNLRSKGRGGGLD